MLASILTELLGDNPPPEILDPCALSVIGQCIYYALGAPVIRRISEDSSPTEENLDRLAAFVRQFSLGGIGRIRASSSLLATR
jgi:hypothetical protein